MRHTLGGWWVQTWFEATESLRKVFPPLHLRTSVAGHHSGLTWLVGSGACRHQHTMNASQVRRAASTVGEPSSAAAVLEQSILSEHTASPGFEDVPSGQTSQALLPAEDVYPDGHTWQLWTPFEENMPSRHACHSRVPDSVQSLHFRPAGQTAGHDWQPTNYGTIEFRHCFPQVPVWGSAFGLSDFTLVHLVLKLVIRLFQLLYFKLVAQHRGSCPVGFAEGHLVLKL